jgi:hypothetical protein
MLDQSLGDLSQSDILYRVDNFISEPGSPRAKEMLQNPNFARRMGELSKAYIMRDQYDNCYHEAKELYKFDIK